MFSCQSYVFFGLTLLLALTGKVKSNPLITISQAQRYLLKYGYLPHTSITYSGTVEKTSFMKAVQEFQSFAGLNITGELDVATLNKMSMPRCGVRDKVKLGYLNGLTRYRPLNRPWITKNLTYNILNYPTGFINSYVDNEIAKAFAVWAETTDLSFTLKKVGRVDINITFAVGEHGDFSPFDGPDNVLAHAFPPAHGGDIHFDNDELWAIGTPPGVSLLQVAAHEMGHSLGLEHSNIQPALMHPFYYGYTTDVKLHPEDIMAIQTLYGKIKLQTAISPKFIPLRRPPYDELCRDPKIDTIFNSTDGQIYAFKGNNYYKISGTALADGYPKLISAGWPRLPGYIDAAFVYKTGKTYFFKGTEYWRYSGRQIDYNFPRKIGENFMGLPDHLDDAVVWNDIIYFYKDSQFWCFEILTKSNGKHIYSKSISNAESWTNDLDDAEEYYQIDAASSTFIANTPPFPRPLVQWWVLCKNASSTTGFEDHHPEYKVNIV